ncbi:ricin-type beta-trefoil lectin domain protein [Dactylosporangium sp. NPDC051541]|uniref:ricin-type beta-trefoil lectin domain protein n=1 Tax=Dactylosporangium sp. NPDC051541 TaxID=3363977 RepID=UPI0037B4001E
MVPVRHRLGRRAPRSRLVPAPLRHRLGSAGVVPPPNAITFADASAWAPDLDAIGLRPRTGGISATGTRSGRRVDIDQANQQWTVNTDGTVRGAQSGRCLDADNNATANGTKLVLWTGNAQSNQRWTTG